MDSRGARGQAFSVRLRWLVLCGIVLGVGACAAGRSTSGDTAVGSPDAIVDEGRIVFLELAEPGCGVCHTLVEAGATGTLGPDLDELRPDATTVIAAVTGGVGIMAAQEHLTGRQIRALATYVARVAGGLR